MTLETGLRVGVNLLYLRPGAVGGSEIYVREVMRHILRLGEARLTVFCAAEVRESLHDAGMDAVIVSHGPFTQVRRLASENLSLAWHLRRHPVDVLWSPANFAAPALPHLVPQVATVHDLQHWWFPQHFRSHQRLLREMLFRTTFRRCRRVIAISEFTRRDILARYGVAPDRVATVLEGIDRLVEPTAAAMQATREAFGLDRPFFFFPAAMAPHKNHLLLLRAFARFLRSYHEPVELILTGQRTALATQLDEEARALGVADRVRHLGYVSREHLYSLMSLAQALMFPSTFEGFGLPLLEAMQCRTPVVASRCASIPEITGEAALLLDPHDIQAWADAMHRLMTEDALRTRLVTAGVVRVDQFSWERCATETLSVLRAAAGTR